MCCKGLKAGRLKVLSKLKFSQLLVQSAAPQQLLSSLSTAPLNCANFYQKLDDFYKSLFAYWSGNEAKEIVLIVKRRAWRDQKAIGSLKITQAGTPESRKSHSLWVLFRRNFYYCHLPSLLEGRPQTTGGENSLLLGLFPCLRSNWYPTSRLNRHS